TMADVNVNAPAEQAPAMAPPTRTENSQSNPIYKIAVDILKHTNFFRAFTTSLTIPSIYIQQFWDTVRYDKNIGSYRCQLDKQWFNLTKDTLRNGLQITPVANNKAFSSPPTPDVLIKFVNDLGYPKAVRTLSDGRKKANLIIPSVRFTKLIIHHLQSKHKFHPRPVSPLHLPNKESVLGYLKFGAKGTKQEVFGMPIPNNLITANIQGEQYYNAYLEKVAKHQRYLASEEVSDPDSHAPKPAKATKPKATQKSKPLAPKAAPITKPTATKASKSQQPKPAPTKPQEKKRKLLSDEFVDEGVPDKNRCTVMKRLILQTEMELVLEHTQQGTSNEVSWVSNSLVHSLRALSTLRRSDLRTASTAAKPCQGDSSEFYLITGRIPTVAAAGKRHIDS
ncbi:hypothetical protein Tco_0465678, partial [Tanacetum coccineum]